MTFFLCFTLVSVVNIILLSDDVMKYHVIKLNHWHIQILTHSRVSHVLPSSLPLFTFFNLSLLALHLNRNYNLSLFLHCNLTPSLPHLPLLSVLEFSCLLSSAIEQSSLMGSLPGLLLSATPTPSVQAESDSQKSWTLFPSYALWFWPPWVCRVRQYCTGRC